MENRSEHCHFYRDVVPAIRAAAGPEFSGVSVFVWAWFYDRPNECKTHLIRLLSEIDRAVTQLVTSLAVVRNARIRVKNAAKEVRRVAAKEKHRQRARERERERWRRNHLLRGGISREQRLALIRKPPEHHRRKRIEYQTRRAKKLKTITADRLRKRLERREYIAWWKAAIRQRKVEAKKYEQRIRRNIRKRLKRVLDSKILTPTRALVGCSLADLKAHLERQFRPGWSWENYGRRWNIDHLVPLAKFDLTKESHVKLSCHYTKPTTTGDVGKQKKVRPADTKSYAAMSAVLMG